MFLHVFSRVLPHCCGRNLNNEKHRAVGCGRAVKKMHKEFLEFVGFTRSTIIDLFAFNSTHSREVVYSIKQH